MRIQSAVLVMVFLGAGFVDAVWSQDSDPFAKPFAAGRQKANQQVTQKPNVTKVGTVKPLAIVRAERIKSGGLPSVSVGVVNESEIEKRSYSALGEATSQEFLEMPLSEAAVHLSESHEIPILIDRQALEDVGISPAEPVTIAMKGIPLCGFLRLMLRDLGLTYTIDDVLLITTPESAEQNLRVRMYRLPDTLKEKSGEVLTALTKTVAVDTWDDLGGPSSATAIDHVLVISTTTSVHLEVEGFLSTLIATYGTPDPDQKTSVPVKTAPTIIPVPPIFGNE